MWAESACQHRGGGADATRPCLHAVLNDSVPHRDDTTCEFYDCTGENRLEETCIPDADEIDDLTRTTWCRQHHQRGGLRHGFDDDHTGRQWKSGEVPNVEGAVLGIGCLRCHTDAGNDVRGTVDKQKRLSLGQELTDLFRA